MSASHHLLVQAALCLIGFQATVPGNRRAVNLDAAGRHAEKFLHAFQEDDRDSMKSIVRATEDPFLIAHALLGTHVDSLANGQGGDEPSTEAVFALVELLDGDEVAAGLEPLAQAWLDLSQEEASKEQSLRLLLREMLAAGNSRRFDRVIELARESAEGIDAGSPLITTVLIRWSAAKALEENRSLTEAGELFRRISKEAGDLGWIRLRAMACYEASRMNLERGALQSALEGFLQTHALCQENGLRETATWCLVAIGNVYVQLSENEKALSTCDEALAETEALGDPLELSNALMNKGTLLMQTGEYAKAIELHQRCLTLRESLGDRRGVAAALHNIGVAQDYLGNREQAFDCFSKSLKEKESLGDEVGAALTRLSLAIVQSNRGESAAALELLTRTMEDMDRLNMPQRTLALGALGSLHDSMGNTSKAIECIQAAVAAGESAGDRHTYAVNLGNLGEIYHSLGRYSEALSCCERSLAVKRSIRNRRGAAITLGVMGLSYESLGQFANAFEACEEALREARGLGDRATTAECLISLARMHRRIGQVDRAMEVLQEALQEWRRIGSGLQCANALQDIAFLHYDAGELDLAITTLEEALEELGPSIRTPLKAHIIADIGLVHAARGEHDRALECYMEGLEEARASGERANAAIYLSRIGTLKRQQGKLDESLRLHQQALEEMETLGCLSNTLDVLWNLGQVHLALGDHERALETAIRALATVKNSSRGLAEGETMSFRSGTHAQVDLGLHSVHRLRAERPQDASNLIQRAFVLVESGRGMLLLEGLLNRNALLGANVDLKLQEAETTARARIARLQQQLLQLAAGNESDTARIQDARAGLDAAYSDLDEAISHTQRDARRVTEIVYPEPVGLDVLRRSLPADSVLISYQLGEDKLFALLVSQESEQLFELCDARTAIEKIQRFLDLVSTSGSQETALASELYELLLRPMESVLRKHHELLISPDGILSFLPMEALILKEPAVERRVTEPWRVSYVPSGTVFVQLLRDRRESDRGNGLLAVGDPIYEVGAGVDSTSSTPTSTSSAGRELTLRGIGSLDRLKASGDEVRAIAGLFGGDKSTLLVREQASLLSLKEALSKADQRLEAIHFACHGYVDTERPRLTGLILSKGEVLTLDQVYRLDINSGLVVLSACETAKGRLEAGEGLVGLVRGFFFAGSPRVIVSDWKVEDESTRSFMVSFYDKLLTNKLTPGAALRQTKLERIRSGGPLAHPSHWAAFVLWGLPE